MIALTTLLLAFIISLETSEAPATATDPLTERLYLDIIQRKDKDLRRQRLEELLEILKDPQAAPARRESALRVLVRVGEVPFDRTPFLPAVKALLESPSDTVRRAALDAMPGAGAGEADLPDIAKLAGDSSEEVRAAVAPSLYFSARGKDAAVPAPIIEKLLADPAEKVKLATLHALWGHTVSAAAEKQIISLSRESMHGLSGSLGYDAVYYALSTRPVVSLPVAQRLIELMQDPQLDPNVRWRAAWGLGHKSSPEAVDVVVQALATELDETLHPYIREYAVQGLATHRTPAALAKLREVAEEEENPRLRQTAAEALK
jgi:HEAT repeat protein